MEKRVYVLLAEGFEILEAIGPITIMRRANLDVKTLSLGETLEVTSSHNVKVTADMMFDELKDGDGIFIPGGYPGYENVLKNDKAMELIKYYLESGKMVAAICGAPSILAKGGLINDRSITLHFATACDAEGKCGEIIDAPVVVDRNLITASGSGYSIDMGFEILEYLAPETIPAVKKGMTL